MACKQPKYAPASMTNKHVAVLRAALCAGTRDHQTLAVQKKLINIGILEKHASLICLVKRTENILKNTSNNEPTK
jgi:hypothetical protein